MTKVLGLTGGIASGKSTADHFFQKQGLPLIDSDQIAHQILTPGQEGYNLVVEKFGPGFLTATKEIDRRRLGQTVFSDQSRLQTLNDITHPLIFREIEDRIAQNKRMKKPLVIVDAPLLFETGGQSYCDQTLLLAVPEQIQLERLQARDGLDEAEALKKIHSQMPLAQKEKLADYVVTNTGTISELENKLAQLLLELKKENQDGMS